MVVGTNITLSLSINAAAPTFNRIRLIPTWLLSGCAETASSTSAVVENIVGNNGTVYLPTPSLVGIYSLCVSSRDERDVDEDYLLHPLQITVIDSVIVDLFPVNASSVSQNQSTVIFLSLRSLSTILPSDFHVVVVPVNVAGCQGAHGSVNIQDVTSTFAHLPPLTFSGQYKVCISLSSSPSDDLSYSLQPATVTVTLPLVSAVSVMHALHTQVVGGVINRLSLIGVAQGDTIALMPSTTVGCSDLSHRSAVVLSMTDAIYRYYINLQLPLSASGLYKICHAPNGADSTVATSYTDQVLTISAVPNIVDSLPTSFANPLIIVRGSTVYLEPIGSSITVNDRIALLPTSATGCESAGAISMQVALVSSSLRIHLPSGGLTTGSYIICYHSAAAQAGDGTNDAHYIRQLNQIDVTAPVVTSFVPLNADINKLVTGREIRISLSGTFKSASERLAVLPASVLGCIGASSSSAFSTLESNQQSVIFSVNSLPECTTLPCDLKVCHSSATAGDDETFSDQGFAGLLSVVKSVVGSRYRQRINNVWVSKYSFVAPAGTIVSVSGAINDGCQGASSSTSKSVPLACSSVVDNGSNKPRCIHTWSNDVVGADFASKSICGAASGLGNTDTSFVEQGIGTDVIWSIDQNTPRPLGTMAGVDRVRTIHAGASDGYLFVVTSSGDSGGVVKFTKYDGSGAQNLLTGLSSPWGFVSDSNHFYVTENSENRISKYLKVYVGGTPTVDSSSNNFIVFNNVCTGGQLPRSIDVESRTEISNTVYYICSDGSTSSMRSLLVSGGGDTQPVTLSSGLPEVKDLVVSNGQAHVACGSSGIRTFALSGSGPRHSLLDGFDHKQVMSMSLVRSGSGGSERELLYFVDYLENIHYLALYEVDISSATSVASIQPKPVALIDFDVLDKASGTQFQDVYIAVHQNGNGFYLQQSWQDPSSHLESVIVRVEKV